MTTEMPLAFIFGKHSFLNLTQRYPILRRNWIATAVRRSSGLHLHGDHRDVEAVRKSGKSREHEKLEEDKDAVEPIVLSEANIVGHLSSPRPPHQSEER